MTKSYSVEITDELEAESPLEALQETLERLRSEETGYVGGGESNGDEGIRFVFWVKPAAEV